MTYNPNIPVFSNYVTLDIVRMKRNSQIIDQVFRQNHTTWNSSLPQYGKHGIVTFKEQSSDPATGATETALYAKDDSGTEKLYARQDASGDVYKVFSTPYFGTHIKLEAYVFFDRSANIISQSPNIDSVTQPDDTLAEYIVNFVPALSTADFFWTVEGMKGSAAQPSDANMVQPTIKSAATWGASVTTSAVRFAWQNEIDGSVGLAASTNVTLIKIYTVA